MRELIATTFLTLDGVMQAPGESDEDVEGDFAYSGWSMTQWDDRMGEVMAGIMAKPFDLVLGRKTYGLFAAFWPNQSDEDGGKPLNDATKYVASRGNPELTWEPSVLLQGDAADAVAKLKATDGPELQVHGSGDLLQTLMGHNLVDRFYVWTFPTLVGSGKRLFADGTVPSTLKLVDNVVSTTGVVIGTYEPAGEIVLPS